jgi:signal transduction histidine kinase
VSRLSRRLLRVAARPNLPRNTIRLRLTAIYGGLFLASGAALLAVNYVIVAHRYNSAFFVSTGQTQYGGFVSVQGSGPVLTTKTGLLPAGLPSVQALTVAGKHQSVAALNTLLIASGIALAIMALISIWLGWLVAGRALRPLRTISNAAREISASNLHRRLALDGPDDELKQLGNTFDALLGRLEASFDAQRQFVANASHELRTPLTLERTLVEVALADPDATVESLRETCERVLAAGEQQERLIEALLTLSRSQRGLDRREPFDLAVVAGEVLLDRAPEAESRRLRVETALDPAPTSGDSALGERLVANLVDNALRHNLTGGRLDVATGTKAGRAVLTVSNSGPPVPPAEVARLFEPFQRLSDRSGHDGGLGLGLSIVHAIAAAHGATLTARARPEGGLTIEVGFPPAEPAPTELAGRPLAGLQTAAPAPLPAGRHR